MGTSGPTCVVPRGHGRTRVWGVGTYQGTAHPLCFGYFLGCLRLDAACISPCASQFLLCPKSRRGVYLSPVPVTSPELLFHVGQLFLVPVIQYRCCYFPSREKVGPSASIPESPQSPWNLLPTLGKDSTLQLLSHHCARPSPECGMCVDGRAPTCLGSRGIPPSRSSYRSLGSSVDTPVLSPSRA